MDAGIGHNQPPEPIDPVAVAIDAIDAALAPLRDRADKIADASLRAAVIDQETAGKAADLVKIARTARKAIDDKRAEIKEPYLSAGQAIDRAARPLIDAMASVEKSVTAKIAQYEREEAARVAAERAAAEAARRRREEADRIAAAEAAARNAPPPVIAPPPPPPVVREPAPVRGEYGASSSSRTVVTATVTDYALAFAKVQANEKVRAAIDTAIAALVRAGERDIPGVTISNETKTVIR